jgi:hypothetical protein
VDPLSIGLIGSSILGGIAQGVLGYSAQDKANATNLQLGRETNAQNAALTRETWARDDTAVQRRKADLEAAGLNPLLAVGSPAANASPIAAQRSQVEANTPQLGMQDMISVIANVMRMRQDFAVSESQRELNEVAALKTFADASATLQGSEQSAYRFGQESPYYQLLTELDVANRMAQIEHTGASTGVLSEQITKIQGEITRQLHDLDIARKYDVAAHEAQIDAARAGAAHTRAGTAKTQLDMTQTEDEIRANRIRMEEFERDARLKGQVGVTSSPSNWGRQLTDSVGILLNLFGGKSKERGKTYNPNYRRR